jgi:hypothetical protein
MRTRATSRPVDSLRQKWVGRHGLRVGNEKGDQLPITRTLISTSGDVRVAWNLLDDLVRSMRPISWIPTIGSPSVPACPLWTDDRDPRGQAPVYKMALASKRYESLGLLDWIARLLDSSKIDLHAGPLLQPASQGERDVYIHETGIPGSSWRTGTTTATRKPATTATIPAGSSPAFRRSSTCRWPMWRRSNAR